MEISSIAKSPLNPLPVLPLNLTTIFCPVKGERSTVFSIHKLPWSPIIEEETSLIYFPFDKTSTCKLPIVEPYM